MTWVNANRTACKRHRCEMCGRVILPGETYSRSVCFDGGSASTSKTCLHCEKTGQEYWVSAGWGDGWYFDVAVEWLEEYYPASYAALLAGWRYPDGELLPYPTFA